MLASLLVLTFYTPIAGVVVLALRAVASTAVSAAIEVSHRRDAVEKAQFWSAVVGAGLLVCVVCLYVIAVPFGQPALQRSVGAWLDPLLAVEVGLLLGRALWQKRRPPQHPHQGVLVAWHGLSTSSPEHVEAAWQRLKAAMETGIAMVAMGAAMLLASKLLGEWAVDAPDWWRHEAADVVRRSRRFDPRSAGEFGWFAQVVGALVVLRAHRAWRAARGECPVGQRRGAR